MKKFLKPTLFLVIIFFVAITLRFYQIGNIPASLNHDETALGYNAYSIMLTGSDEHGVFMPLSLQSFGDWKLPVYPLVDIIFIKLLGLNELAVRLPSALAGLISVFLLYKITTILFRNKKISLLVSLFLAVSPWSIYFSRMAYEVNLATALFLGGLLCFLKFKEEKKLKYLIFTSILFGLTIFTYHAYVIFMPIFFVALLGVYSKGLGKNKFTFSAILIFILFVLLSIGSTFQGSIAKVSALGIFTDQNTIYNRADILRADNAAESHILKQVLHNKYFAVTYQIAQNYLISFSPKFLFDTGGEKLLHTTGVFGNLYLFDAFLLVIGMFALFWRREKSLPLLIIWAILSPLPSSITRDAPSTTRLFIMLPLLMIVVGLGAWQVIQFLSSKKFYYKIILVILACLYTLNVIYFLDIYFNHIDTLRGRYLHYGFKQIVQLSDKYPNYNIVVRGPDNFPYISFLFYDKYDPRTFHKEVKYYPTTSEGFLLVKEFGRYSFVDSIDYSNLKPHTLYIDDRKTDDPAHSIKLPSGEYIFNYTLKN